MSTLLNGCLALAVGCAWPAAPVWANHVATGQTCGLSSMYVTGGPDQQNGYVSGGPVTAAEPGAVVTIRCTVQVGAVGATHDGPDAAFASFMQVQSATLPPSGILYLASAGQLVYLCTEWRVHTATGVGTYYFDSPTRVFSTSPSAACVLALDLRPATQGYAVSPESASV